MLVARARNEHSTSTTGFPEQAPSAAAAPREDDLLCFRHRGVPYAWDHAAGALLRLAGVPAHDGRVTRLALALPLATVAFALL